MYAHAPLLHLLIGIEEKRIINCILINSLIDLRYHTYHPTESLHNILTPNTGRNFYFSSVQIIGHKYNHKFLKTLEKL